MAGSRPYRFSAQSHLPLSDVIKAQSSPDPISGCWIWTGRRVKTHGLPYGRLSYRGVPMAAHRAAWESFNGTIIPPKGVVRHKCDNPPCVNPDHLELGTQADNMADRQRRGRCNFSRGGDHPHAKLTAEDVLIIRASSESPSILAKRYGLWGASSINNIRQRRSWKHI